MQNYIVKKIKTHLFFQLIKYKLYNLHFYHMELNGSSSYIIISNYQLQLLYYYSNMNQDRIENNYSSFI